LDFTDKQQTAADAAETFLKYFHSITTNVFYLQKKTSITGCFYDDGLKLGLCADSWLPVPGCEIKRTPLRGRGFSAL